MDDQMLADLLTDAVADVEPADRLAEIRSRTATRPRRYGWYAAGGTVLAAAAAVTAIALAGNQAQPEADDKGPVATNTPEPTPTMSAYPVYYLGETPTGTRLFREFQRAPGSMFTEVAIQLLARAPQDPDYRTPWPNGSFETAKVTGSGDSRIIEVTVMDESLHDRPDAMSEAEARLAIEQVIYTLHGVVGERLPVQFRMGGNPVDQVLGVPTAEPLTNSRQLQVLSLVSISNPIEGEVVSGSFSADGAASSFEATVPWEIQNAAGDTVLEGFATASGYVDRLYPWETDPIDVSSLTPGTYTFVAMTADMSDGEGPDPYVDTRTIVVE